MNLECLKQSPYSDAQWEQEIQRLGSGILKVAAPIAIAVFGSSVQWERKATSDIDLAIIFETEEEATEASKRILLAKLAKDIPVDWLFFGRARYLKSCETGSIGWVIHQHGRLIHGQDPAR